MTIQGRCSGELCWYTLDLDDDGLVVPHSKSGVIEVCEGGGRPPRPSLKQERADRLAAAREAVAWWLSDQYGGHPDKTAWLGDADKLLSLSEVQALIGGQP